MVFVISETIEVSYLCRCECAHGCLTLCTIQELNVPNMRRFLRPALI